MDFPPLTIPKTDNGCITSGKDIFLITHSVNVSNGSILPDSDVRLLTFVDNFRKENPHICIEATRYWADGDDQDYNNYITIYFSLYPWYTTIMEKDIKFVIKGREFYLFWIAPTGIKLMDAQTRKTYFLYKDSLELVEY